MVTPEQISEYLGQFQTLEQIHTACVSASVQAEPGIPSCCAFAKLIEAKFPSVEVELGTVRVFPIDKPHIEFGPAYNPRNISLTTVCADFACRFDSELYPDLIDPKWFAANHDPEPDEEPPTE